MEVSSTVSAVPASVYVGDLHPDISDDDLLDAFSEFESLASVRVCRDSNTSKSLCYGYVNFISPQEAIRAIEVKNNSLLKGKMIRVMWSNRDPDARKSGIGNVFVKNLPESTDNSRLQELFQKFGNIFSCKVAMYEDGKSKGYGFVQFESEESAKAAIEKLNGSTVGDRQIYVGKFMRKNDRVSTSLDIRYTNLYVKNLDPEVTEELLQKKFSAFGKIVSLVVATDENGASKGFGFVNFENPDDARHALEAMNGAQLGSKTLYVARAQKKAERAQIVRYQLEEKRKGQLLKCKGSNLYVKNIADGVTDEDLRKHFSSCGTIISAKLMQNEKGISKGFGFVCFSTPEEANIAMITFNGVMFRGKPLYVAVAQRKEDRIEKLKNLFALAALRLPGLHGPSTALISGDYPYYYPAPGVISQISRRPRMLLSPVGFWPGWRTTTTTQQRTGHANRYVRNGGSQMLHSQLAAASPEQRRQILGERLLPLVWKHQPKLASKITGMLLEMDNSEVLLLLESPQCLSAKVNEAVVVLKNSRIAVSGQESLHTNCLSSQVAVN